MYVSGILIYHPGPLAIAAMEIILPEGFESFLSFNITTDCELSLTEKTGVLRILNLDANHKSYALIGLYEKRELILCTDTNEEENLTTFETVLPGQKLYY